MDRVPCSTTRIVYEDRVPRSRIRIVYEDRVPRSGTRIVYEDRSVTFRHQDRMRSGVSRTNMRGIKIMNLEIMLINSNEKNLYPK